MILPSEQMQWPHMDAELLDANMRTVSLLVLHDMLSVWQRISASGAIHVHYQAQGLPKSTWMVPLGTLRHTIEQEIRLQLGEQFSGITASDVSIAWILRDSLIEPSSRLIADAMGFDPASSVGVSIICSFHVVHDKRFGKTNKLRRERHIQDYLRRVELFLNK